jgi:hypothetical protein
LREGNADHTTIREAMFQRLLPSMFGSSRSTVPCGRRLRDSPVVSGFISSLCSRAAIGHGASDRSCDAAGYPGDGTPVLSRIGGRSRLRATPRTGVRVARPWTEPALT